MQIVSLGMKYQTFFSKKIVFNLSSVDFVQKMQKVKPILDNGHKFTLRSLCFCHIHSIVFNTKFRKIQDSGQTACLYRLACFFAYK